MRRRQSLIYASITVATVVAMIGLSAAQPIFAYALALGGLTALIGLFYLAGRVE